MIRVEVMYALPQAQHREVLSLAEGATLEQAIIASGFLERFSELELGTIQAGIWGRKSELSHPLQQDDRVEIYRPLLANPKELRKLRASRAKEQGRIDPVTGGRLNPLRKSSN
ncbi:RnfH family protein [Dongshaea marina]|uniref:RnfH family protein n=1 Tax=Dongshaea marina TaxID=2047966 RepID=UPI001F258485|nr:RnfH family protein [Dongshaea marina]